MTARIPTHSGAIEHPRAIVFLDGDLPICIADLPLFKEPGAKFEPGRPYSMEIPKPEFTADLQEGDEVSEEAILFIEVTLDLMTNPDDDSPTMLRLNMHDIDAQLILETLWPKPERPAPRVSVLIGDYGVRTFNRREKIAWALQTFLIG